jgi:Niemann-Pick C1 protein
MSLEEGSDPDETPKIKQGHAPRHSSSSTRGHKHKRRIKRLSEDAPGYIASDTLDSEGQRDNDIVKVTPKRKRKQEQAPATTRSKAWTSALVKIRKPVSKGVLVISDAAARNPKSIVILGIVLSLILVVIGLFTNFHVVVDGDVLWTPTPSTVLAHGEWTKHNSGFPAAPRWLFMSVHADGENILSQPQEGIQRVFTAIDVAVTTEGYDDLCDHASISMPDENGNTTCLVNSATRFWNYSMEAFVEQLHNSSEIIQVLSRMQYPDGTPVDTMLVLGNAERDGDGTLMSSMTYIMSIAIPEVDEALDFEENLLENILDLQQQWDMEQGNIFRVEIFTQRSFDDEFRRAIVKDIPLVPLIFVVMSLFTCLVFYRRSWVYSRCMLGLGAVFSILLSIMFVYGVMFIIGVPFTSMTQVVPFVMFGIGLDDAFIIWGAYQRSDRDKTVEERIHDTMEEIGVSIFVTSLTSVTAFSLGCTSSVPAVYWLCQYTAPTIAIDFVFQITFFVALIVLDERRVAQKKRDCFTCFAAPGRDDEDEEEPEPQGNIVDRFMVWFSNFLMIPVVKVVVLVTFFGIFGGMAYSASLLEQRFEFTDVLPSPSYVGDFWDTFTTYTGGSGVSPDVVFRGVDQSDAGIQQQMEDYVNALVAMEQVEDQPEFFWLRDFQTFINSNQSVAEAIATLPSSEAFAGFANSTGTIAVMMAVLSFEEQLDAFLAVPVFYQLYNDNIVRDADGTISASRTTVRMTKVDQQIVVEQVDALENQRAVTESQTANDPDDPDDWAFFTFGELYYIWQFYTDSPHELMLTTVLGVSAVSIISMIFIPHWSAVLFVTPIISILYVDLLGFLQVCGIAVNAVSYISLVMSIGLLVDFLLHIMLRYYESKKATREDKVKDVLQTMGTSILIGGISTFLGVLPLFFSSSEIFNTIFICFLGLVVLGVTHGLIFLPVVLSLLGPNVVLEL